MLIILEGPDGAGKSTLARELTFLLSQHAKVDNLHAGPLTEHPLDAYEVSLATYRPSEKHIICDRWHLGEAVYPALFRRKTRWDRAVAEHVNLFLLSRGACIIVLNPRISELRLRVDLRGDNLITKSDIEYIAKSYHAIKSHHYTYRYTTETPTPSEIVRHARRLHLNASALNSFETYVGTPKPYYLLLGDVRAPRAQSAHPGLPAFMPYGATSGHYLLSSMHLRPATWQQLGIANACDTDDVEALWRILGRPKIVTLGARAHSRVIEYGLPHGAVPHPQYLRRFHFVHGGAYAKLIFTAADTGKDLRTWRPS